MVAYLVQYPIYKTGVSCPRGNAIPCLYVPIYDTIVPKDDIMIHLMSKSRTMPSLLWRFFSNPKAEHYVRELERLTHKPIASIQRQLAILEKEGVIKSRKEGPLKYYSLNMDYRYMPELESVILREARRNELERNLRKILRILKMKYRPDKVIAFGSHVRGRLSPDSDLDILIVKDAIPQRYWDRVKEIAPLLTGCTVGVDYVIWTSKELENSIVTNMFLRNEILQKGKVVYDRAA